MSSSSDDNPRILVRAEHSISRRSIDSNAIKVLYRLHHAGYRAFLVGGGVRDLMLGGRPKDFDVSTDARPQQIRRLFRNSRIIGRRFRLAHVFFHGGIVEVATFRRDPAAAAQDSGAHGLSSRELLITDDNVFGNPREDAFRRDFTVNALFYDISDFSVIDYVGGIEDLDNGLIRAIGEPGVRFREDPVRMLRACEYAGRLGFTIDEKTSSAIRHNRNEIGKASSARLTEELVQLLRCGRAAPALQWMMDLALLEVFLPEAYSLLSAGSRGAGEFENILPAIDELISAGREISDSALLAALLLPNILMRRRDVEALRKGPLGRGQLQKLAIEVAEPFVGRFTISNRRTEEVAAALRCFFRLGERWRSLDAREHFATKPGCRDAVSLLEILVVATGVGHKELDIWQRVARDTPRPSAARKPARRRRRRGQRRTKATQATRKAQ